MSDDIHDPIDLGVAGRLLNKKKPPPMAMCRCGQPLICTMEFRGAEFYCQVCGAKYGWLGPRPAEWTQKLQDRHDELKAVYDAERDEHHEANRKPGDPDYEPSYEWPPVTSVDDHKRAELRHIPGGARPFVDGHWVGTDAYDRFQKEWLAFYDANESEAPRG